jgi:hypothetical protein
MTPTEFREKSLAAAQFNFKKYAHRGEGVQIGATTEHAHLRPLIEALIDIVCLQSEAMAATINKNCCRRMPCPMDSLHEALNAAAEKFKPWSGE